MTSAHERIFVVHTLARVRAGQLNRRQAARVLAAFSLALTGAGLSGRDLAAAPNPEPIEAAPLLPTLDASAAACDTGDEADGDAESSEPEDSRDPS